jgi:hypothetical protein
MQPEKAAPNPFPTPKAIFNNNLIFTSPLYAFKTYSRQSCTGCS